MDLIDRQAAIEAVEKESQVDGSYGYMDTKSIVDLLEDLPSAQRTGHWKKGGEQPYFRKHFDIVVCSECNKRGERRWNYCPNCGSKMEVEHD